MIKGKLKNIIFFIAKLYVVMHIVFYLLFILSLVSGSCVLNKDSLFCQVEPLTTVFSSYIILTAYTFYSPFMLGQHLFTQGHIYFIAVVFGLFSLIMLVTGLVLWLKTIINKFNSYKEARQ